jgi:hypothetical protein
MNSLNCNPALAQMLQRVRDGSDAQQQQRLREVLQEIALAGVVRRGFFGKAEFYGVTCLHIFHGLPRFSENLVFSLLQPDPSFALQPYLRGFEADASALLLLREVLLFSGSVCWQAASGFFSPMAAAGEGPRLVWPGVVRAPGCRLASGSSGGTGQPEWALAGGSTFHCGDAAGVAGRADSLARCAQRTPGYRALRGRCSGAGDLVAELLPRPGAADPGGVNPGAHGLITA